MPGHRRNRRQRLSQSSASAPALASPSSPPSEIGATPANPLVRSDALPVGLQAEEVSSVSAGSPSNATVAALNEDTCADGPYIRAKRAEATQDFESAIVLYRQAIDAGDRAESAVKDVSGILHSLGRSREAVAFLTANEHILVDRRAYQNLLENLRRLWQVETPETPDFMRTVQVCIQQKDLHISPVLGWHFCEKIFRNSARILRIVVCGNGRQGFVEFASHSAARKAIQHCEENGSVVVSWARPEVRTSLLGEIVADDTAETPRTASSDAGEAAANSTIPANSTSALIFAGPQVCHLPRGCFSAADLPVFHLLPGALWRALNLMDWYDNINTEASCTLSLPATNSSVIDAGQLPVFSPPPGLPPPEVCPLVPPGLPPPEVPVTLRPLEGSHRLARAGSMAGCPWPGGWGA